MEVKRDQVHVCSPLGVVPKKNAKLRFLNNHLAKRKQVFASLRSGYLATLISKLIIGQKLSTPMSGCSTLFFFASWIFSGDSTP